MQYNIVHYTPLRIGIAQGFGRPPTPIMCTTAVGLGSIAKQQGCCTSAWQDPRASAACPILFTNTHTSTSTLGLPLLSLFCVF